MIELAEKIKEYHPPLKWLLDEHIKHPFQLPNTYKKLIVKIRVLDSIFERNDVFIIERNKNFLIANDSSANLIYTLSQRTLHRFGHSYGSWWIPKIYHQYPIYFTVAWKKSSTIYNMKLPIIGWYQINDNLILCSYPNYTKIANGARNNYPLMFKKLKTFLNCNDDDKINNIINVCMEMNH